MENLKARIVKGIAYFQGIKPSQWNAAHTAHLKLFLELVEKYLESKPESDIVEIAEQIFETKSEGRL